MALGRTAAPILQVHSVEGCADGVLPKGFCARRHPCCREDARDAFVSSRYESLAAMPAGRWSALPVCAVRWSETRLPDARFQAGAW